MTDATKTATLTGAVASIQREIIELKARIDPLEDDLQGLYLKKKEAIRILDSYLQESGGFTETRDFRYRGGHDAYAASAPNVVITMGMSTDGRWVPIYVRSDDQ